MNESAVVFGRWNHLVGVCGRPVDNGKTRNVAVLMLTPGMLHHVGPMRLHVKMARRLSELGIVSLRFCLSGIGESLAVAASGTSTERAVDEIREAMEWIKQEYGIERFVLFGLCSGADDGVYAAVADQRVEGLVLMDGCGFQTFGYHMRRWLLLRPQRAIARMLFALRSVARLRRVASSGATSLPAGDDIREFPERKVAEKEFQSLIDRGTQLFFIYTGGASSYYNGASQFAEMFPQLRLRNRVTCKYLPDLDHVARLTEDRALIVDEVTSWIDARFTERLPKPTPAVPLCLTHPIVSPVPLCGV